MLFRSEVKTAEGYNENFEVKVGLHQASVLTLCSLFIVMEVVSKEFRGRLPQELLYTDDLVLMAESMEELNQKVRKWKSGMDDKGLKVNVGKTKFMVGCEGVECVEESGKWPCGICGSGLTVTEYNAPSAANGYTRGAVE